MRAVADDDGERRADTWRLSAAERAVDAAAALREAVEDLLGQRLTPVPSSGVIATSR